jgi:hypothetical protein
MRTAAFVALAAGWLLVALVAAFGRWGLVAGAGVLCVACVLAAGVAAGEERRGSA